MLLPLLTASLLPLSALAHSTHSHSHANSRKSLSFGPVHPHHRFDVHEVPTDGFKAAVVEDPMGVARRNLMARTGGVEGQDWYIRDDSYTDKNTLVTHVYARQLVNGLPIVDADINLNIDGTGNVLSSGSSFFQGKLPALDLEATANPKVREAHCSTLLSTLQSTTHHFRSLLSSLSLEAAAEHLLQFGHDQLHFGSHTHEPTKPIVDSDDLERVSLGLKELTHSYSGLCPQDTKHSLLEALHLSATPQTGAAPALLSFLALVTPSSELKAEIHKQPSAFLEKMTSTFSHSALPGSKHSVTTEHIEGAPGTVSPVKATLGYQQSGEGDLVMVWRLEVEMLDNWYEGTVDVKTGRVVGAVDWARDAPAAKKPSGPPIPTYNVWPLGVNDPVSGNRSLLTSPFDSIASPAGWHSFPGTSPFLSTTPGVHVGGGGVNTTTTLGNNVFAQENWEGQSNWVSNYRPVANSSLIFDYEYGAEEGLRPKEYVDLAVTELFYTCNMFHDLTYRLGFDELSGNFQQANFGKGGKGGDAVIAMAQDGSGTNNANFATPPDGQNGRMRMYVWSTATPYRDGDLEAGIVIHEYAHGLSTRLTGGPANSGCLGWGESGGMGEGWGDFIATQIRKTTDKKYSDYPMGAWAANRAGGIRNYPYSTNETVNPSTYKTLDKPGYFGVHAIGEVWAELLFLMTENLISKHGFSHQLFPPTNTSAPNDYYTATAEVDSRTGLLAKPLVPKAGNTLALQLVINGMKLQPCRPSFSDARDAIIQADTILTGGSNACEIWSAFADRGLGPNAALRGGTPWGGGVHVEDYTIPKGVCKGDKKVGA